MYILIYYLIFKLFFICNFICSYENPRIEMQSLIRHLITDDDHFSHSFLSFPDQLIVYDVLQYL